MAQILITEDGKRVQITPDKDVKLYDAPSNPPNTGTNYTRGTDLYAHKARSGNWYYYTRDWSMWQGEKESINLINREEAIEFLQAMATLTGWAEISQREMEMAKKIFGIDIFEEDA